MRMTFFFLLGFLLLPTTAVARDDHAHSAAEPDGACTEALPNLRCARSPTPTFDAGGRLWLAWYDRGHIYVQHSDDRGQTLSEHALIRFTGPDAPRPSVRVTFDDWEIHGCPHQGPALARSGNILHLAWFTAGPKRQGLFYARRENDKTGTPMPLGQPGAERPAVAAMGDVVVLAWKIFIDDRTRVYAQRSVDGGRSWAPPSAIAETAGASDHPLLVSDGRQIYLSWQTSMEGYRLFPLAPEQGDPQ